MTERPAIALTDEQKDIVAGRRGPLFVSAGAGSGKTEVVMSCFIDALRCGDATFDEILTITFTEKAAGVMMRRVRRLLKERGMTGEMQEVEKAQISTIHGFCSRLIRRYSLTLGIDPDFSVADKAQADVLAEESFKACLERLFDRFDDEALEFLMVLDAPSEPLAGKIIKLYDALRSQGQLSPDFEIPEIDVKASARELQAGIEELRRIAQANNCGDKRDIGTLEALESALAEPDFDKALELSKSKPSKHTRNADFKAEADKVIDLWENYRNSLYSLKAISFLKMARFLLQSFHEEYSRNKRAAGVLDFEDLQLQTLKLLTEHPAIRDTVAAGYKLIMVDEFQDTNWLQYKIISLLERANLITVGDQNQSIYRFRNAEVELFRRRQRRLGGQFWRPLKGNWRSHREILDFVDHIFDRPEMLGDGYLKLAPMKDPDGNQEEFRTELILVNNAPLEDRKFNKEVTTAAEAELVARRLQELHDLDPPGNYQYGEMAILLRTRSDAEKYRAALERAGIPGYLGIGREYYKKLELGEALSFLRLLVNPLDDVALLGILRSPMVGVDIDTLLKLREIAGTEDPPPLWPVLGEQRLIESLSGEDREKIDIFVNGFKAMRRRSRRQTLPATVREVISYNDYAAVVAAGRHGKRKYANLLKLQDLALDFEEAWGRDLGAFTEFLMKQRGGDVDEGDAATEEEETGSVRILTIHSAKGLEFPLVVWADMGSGSRWRAPTFLSSEDGRLGLYYKHRGEKLELFAYKELRQREKELDLAEEKRVGYVAMTRAERHLILCGAAKFEKPESVGGTGSTAPIEWIRWVLGLNHETGRLDLVTINEERGYGGPAALRFDNGLSLGLTYCVDPEKVATLAESRTRQAEDLDIGIVNRDITIPVQPAEFIPPTISPSALDTYSACPRRYYFENLLRTGDLPATGLQHEDVMEAVATATGTGNLPATEMGTLVHKILEELALPPSGEITAEAAYLDLLARRLFGPGTALNSHDYEGVSRLLNNFQGASVFAEIQSAAAGGRLRREHRFATLIDRTILTGMIDALCLSNEDGPLVIDYKTGVLEAGQSADEIAKQYQYQIKAYALAACREHPGPVRVALVFLDRPGEEYIAEFSEGDIDEFAVDLEDQIGKMAAGAFDPLDRPEPRYCALCSGGPNRMRLCPTGAKLNAFRR